MMLKKIISVLTPAERRKTGWLLLLDIVVNIADIVALAVLLYLIQFYAGSLSPDRKAWMPAGLTRPGALMPILLFFLLFSCKNFLGWLVFKAQQSLLTGVATRISRSRMMAYLHGDWSGYVNTDSSVWIRQISHEPLEFCQHVLGGVQQVITQSVLIIMTVLAITLFNASIFLLLVAILVPPALVVFYLVRTRLRKEGSQARERSERALQHLQEALAGYVESNVYGKNESFLNKYVQQQSAFNSFVARYGTLQAMPARMIEIFALLGIVILVALNGGGNTALITVGVFMAAAYKIIPGIVKLLSLSGQISHYSFTIERMKVPTAANGVVMHEEPIRSIQFRDVSFSYGERSVINGQNFQLGAGDFIGISGPSGQGKTTLLHLLLGFLEQDKGEILINGRSVSADERRGFWKDIAYVKQQPFLIHDSVLYNITLNGQHYSAERFASAISVSGAERLRDTQIQEHGKNISGGQRQRIAIARALYKDAGLIILDEPFNELDSESEQKLLDHFRELAFAGKIVILITHNKESFSYCNKIIRLDEQQG